MPAIFNHHAVSFQYPENWSLEDVTQDEDVMAVTIYSPSGAYWSLTRYPSRVSASKLAEDALAALRDEYGNLDAEPIEDEIAGQTMEGYNIDFIHLDLISTAVVRTWTTAQGTFVVHCQAEDREYGKLADVFRAITHSLIVPRYGA
jgi:hypothetical protein